MRAMVMTCVAFAGLSPLRERILRESLRRSIDVEVIEPWTSLAALSPSVERPDGIDVLFVELAGAQLPDALRAMLASSSRLRIVGLSVDAEWAKVFELREHQTVLLQCVADDLCAAIGAAARHAA